VLTTTPTFVMYRLSARARGLRVIEVPLDDAWLPPLLSLERAIDFSRPNLIFLATPNNPTGTVIDRAVLERVIELARDALVVIDEAYVDYAAADHLELLRHPNIAILRTLSKVGWASLRVGWLVASAPLVAELDKLRLPYNLPVPTQRLATLALGALAPVMQRTVERVVAERERLTAALGELPGLSVTPSQANFLWVHTERPSGELHAALAARGVLTRSFHARGGRLAHQLRVTIGAPDENDALLAALRDLPLRSWWLPRCALWLGSASCSGSSRRRRAAACSVAA
jgi:histidinol-phosphate aminotransferase